MDVNIDSSWGRTMDIALGNILGLDTTMTPGGKHVIHINVVFTPFILQFHGTQTNPFLFPSRFSAIYLLIIMVLGGLVDVFSQPGAIS